MATVSITALSQGVLASRLFHGRMCISVLKRVKGDLGAFVSQRRNKRSAIRPHRVSGDPPWPRRSCEPRLQGTASGNLGARPADLKQTPPSGQPSYSRETCVPEAYVPEALFVFDIFSGGNEMGMLVSEGWIREDGPGPWEV